MEKTRNQLHDLAVSYTAALIAVHVAYAPLLVAGIWERNVFSFQGNLTATFILGTVFFATDLSPWPRALRGIIYGVLTAYFIGAMVTLVPPSGWIYWLPVHLYLAAGWACCGWLRPSIKQLIAPPNATA